MQNSSLLLLLLMLAAISFVAAQKRSLAFARDTTGSRVALHSLPRYYGYLAALWAALPALALILCWLVFEDRAIAAMVKTSLPVDIQSLPESEVGLYYNQLVSVADTGALAPELRAAADYYRELRDRSARLKALLALLLAVLGGALAWYRIRPELRARNQVEGVFRWGLFSCSLIAVLTTLGIVLSVLFEAIRFFQAVPPTDFFFGLDWSPQTAIRADQAGASGAFGFVPLLVGTLLISAVAMLVAVPIGLMSAIYMAEYATPRFRAIAKPALEILAGVPTVVYGFFAALTVAPFIRRLGESLGLEVASESALAAGLVMGIMIIPFVMSLSDDIIKAVPDSMREASLGMGATLSETITRVVIPAALPGIVGGILLAVSRAIGETMIVVMAAGLAANLTVNPLEAVTTITVQIVTLLVGDQEFDSPKTLAAFALGLVLFFLTLMLNVVALYVVRRYRERYE